MLSRYPKQQSVACFLSLLAEKDLTCRIKGLAVCLHKHRTSDTVIVQSSGIGCSRLQPWGMVVAMHDPCVWFEVGIRLEALQDLVGMRNSWKEDSLVGIILKRKNCRKWGRSPVRWSMVKREVGSAGSGVRSSGEKCWMWKKNNKKSNWAVKFRGKERVIFKMQTSPLINQVELPDEFISHK